MRKLYEEVLKMNSKGEHGVMITVVDKNGHGPAIVGKKLLLNINGITKGTIGGGKLEFIAIEKAKSIISEILAVRYGKPWIYENKNLQYGL